MLKYMIGLLILSWFNLVMAQEASYYALNPKATERALAQCPAAHPNQVSCEELEQIALRINDLAMELRLNPQAYGRVILAMQEKVANQLELSKHNTDAALRVDLIHNQQALRERLSIINWLESPHAG